MQPSARPTRTECVMSKRLRDRAKVAKARKERTGTNAEFRKDWEALQKDAPLRAPDPLPLQSARGEGRDGF
jgi:hypothetical protein